MLPDYAMCIAFTAETFDMRPRGRLPGKVNFYDPPCFEKTFDVVLTFPRAASRARRVALRCPRLRPRSSDAPDRRALRRDAMNSFRFSTSTAFM
jgi:hypothetical protein